MKTLTGWVIERPGMLIPVFFLSLCQTIFSQTVSEGAVSAGLAGCLSVLQGIYSVSGNQAGLGHKGKKEIAVGTDIPFHLKELGSSSLYVSFPLSNGNLAGKFTSSGIPGFRSTALWTAYGLQTGKRVSAGIGLFYNLASTREQLNHFFTASFAGGIQVKMSEEVMIGGHLLFPYHFSTSKGPSHPLLSRLSLGASYQIHSISRIMIDYALEEKHGSSVRLAAETFIGDVIIFRSGFMTHPATFSMGFGFLYQRIELHSATRFVSHYGPSSYASVHYVF